MEFKSLAPLGFSKYKINRLGTIIGPGGEKLARNGIVFLYKDNPRGSNIRKRVHMLVATMFVPNPEGYTKVRFKDGDRLNHAYDNLEWCP